MDSDDRARQAQLLRRLETTGAAPIDVTQLEYTPIVGADGDRDDVVGRTVRAIIMTVDAGLQKLVLAGFDRKRDRMQIESDAGDVVPQYITLNGSRVFSASVEIEPESGKLRVVGRWLTEKLPKPRM